MKIKTLINLALSNIRSRKKLYITIGMIIFIISSGLISGQNLYTNQYYTEKAQKQDIYGTWFAMYEDIDEQKFQEYMEQTFAKDLINEYGLIYNYGSTNHFESLGYVEGENYQACGIHLIEGNLEALTTAHEGRVNIVVDENFFFNHQIAPSINQEVTFQYKDYQKKSQEIQAYIVGIYEIKDFKVAKKTYPTILLTQQLENSTKRVNGFANRRVDSSYFAYQSYVENPNGYDNGVLGNYDDTVAILNYMMVYLGIGIIVILGITYSSLKSKGKELTLLRGIGATKMQLLFMILFECLIVYVIAQILSILFSMSICYVIMNILNKESYINATLYSDAIIIGSICSFAFAIIGFFIPVSYTMKNALTGTFDHKNFQYFQIRYKKLKKQTAKQLAYRSLSTNKKFTIILIIATICPIYCFAQLQKTITNTTQEKQSFLEEELPFLDKYVTIESRETDMDIDIVTQLKQYTKDVQAFPMYPIDISDINITQQSVNDGSQITGEYCLSAINQNYMKIIDSSKYIGRFPQKDDEVFLTNKMFERVNIDGERVDSIEYDLGDTIIVKDQVMKVVGFTTPSIYVKVDGICSYEYRTNYLMENAFYVTEATYQKLTQKSANEINYIKAFADTDNYQDVSVLMSHYSQYIGVPIRDSYQVIENMKTEIVDDYQSDIDTQKMTTIIVACSAFMIYAFMNYYDIIAHKKEYAMLKILGATSSKLIIMQFFKALIITSFSSCIALVFLIQEFNISQLSSLISIIFIFVPMLVVMSLIYIIPILSLIKQDPLEILGIED